MHMEQSIKIAKCSVHTLSRNLVKMGVLPRFQPSLTAGENRSSQCPAQYITSAPPPGPSLASVELAHPCVGWKGGDFSGECSQLPTKAGCPEEDFCHPLGRHSSKSCWREDLSHSFHVKQLSTFFHGTVRTTDSISLSSTLLYVAIARAPLPHHPVFCNHLSVPLCILERIVGQLHTPLILQTTISKFSFHSSLVLRASTAFPATIFSVAVFAFIPHVRNWVLAVLFFSPFSQTFHFSSSFKNPTPLKLIPSDYVTCPLSWCCQPPVSSSVLCIHWWFSTCFAVLLHLYSCHHSGDFKIPLDDPFNTSPLCSLKQALPHPLVHSYHCAC